MDDSIRIIYYVGAILSFFGSLFIIFCVLLMKKIRSRLTNIIVLFIALANLGSCSFDLLSLVLIWMPTFPNTLCQVQGLGLQFSALCSFIWTSSLGFHIYCSVCLKKSNDTMKSFFKVYFLLSILLPAATLVGSVFDNEIVPMHHQPWCWLKGIRRFIYYYGPLVILWIFNVIIYYFLSRASLSIVSYRQMINSQKRRLRLYVLIFIIAKIPALINRICNAASGECTILSTIQTISDPLYGFFYFLVFLYIKKNIFMECCTKIPAEQKPLLTVNEIPGYSIPQYSDNSTYKPVERRD